MKPCFVCGKPARIIYHIPSLIICYDCLTAELRLSGKGIEK